MWKRRFLLALLIATFVGAILTPAKAEHGNAEEAFEATWQRTDLPVLTTLADRTWIWGPEAASEIFHEEYAEAEGGVRSVQYYDKARMEVTDVDADQSSIWYVTNGLLVNEMMTGRIQVGDNAYIDASPAEVNVAGDATDPFGPTYRTFGEVLDEPAAAVGEILNQRLSRSGTISIDASLEDQGVQAAVFAPETEHTVAQPFWDFMTSSGTIYDDGEFITDTLFENPFFATGLPVSEAYWADVRVDGDTTLVLLQCFERRCLTYTPENEPGWQVEAGNVGLHYREWRYGADGAPTPNPANCQPGSGPNYAGQRLVQPSFIAQDLACAVFTGTTIVQGNFSEANAFRADFSGADLRQPILRNTLLDQATFAGASLDLPVFTGATAVEAVFSEATLVQPIFQNSNLLGAQLGDAVMIMPQFTNTICPDSTNSDDNGGTCMGHLDAIPPPTP